MKDILFLILCLPLAACGTQARERINLAEDEASHSAYNGGWNNGSNSAGSGFGGWQLATSGKGQTDSHAGHVIVKQGAGSEVDHAAIRNRAFALYANGTGFESAVAFRHFNEPLAPGDSFSLLMESGVFEPKFQTDDPRPGWVGFALRSGTAAGQTDDYLKGSRFEFGVRQGQPHYFISDGGSDTDTGVPVNPSGVAVTVTLVSADSFDLEITALDTRVTKKFSGRRFAGPKGAKIESFSIANQDGEKGDAYFNGFQVSRLTDPVPR
jgi:hypothetical protein